MDMKIEDIFMLLILSDYISFEKLFYIEQYYVLVHLGCYNRM